MRLSECISSENDDSVRALVECVEDSVTTAIEVSKSQEMRDVYSFKTSPS